jgi:hypothetical protein
LWLFRHYHELFYTFSRNRFQYGRGLGWVYIG